MKISITTKIKQATKHYLSQKMLTSITILSLPVLELKNWLLKQAEQNPLIIIKEKTNKLSSVASLDYLPTHSSLYDSLIFQAHLEIHCPEKLKIAKYIIGSLDSHGFFTQEKAALAQEAGYPLKEIAEVLTIIQTFDPPGIAAENVQHSLLLQLERNNKQKSLAYKVFREYFKDLLNNKISDISRKLNIPIASLYNEIKQVLKKLTTNPASQFQPSLVMPIIPDIIAKHEQNKWIITTNEEDLPLLQLQKVDNMNEVCCKSFLTSGKKLFLLLNKRKEFLIKLTVFIIQKHKGYLLHQTNMLPLTYKEAAIELNVNISTIARAVSGKYIDSPLGILPMKHFFPRSTTDKNISNKTALDLLKSLINEENKKRPLSDKRLSEKMQEQGIPCSRRIVTKYRKKLNIPSSKHRIIFDYFHD